MNTGLQEVIEQHYEETDEQYWYRCKACGAKVYARPDDASDMALHEVKNHPER